MHNHCHCEHKLKHCGVCDVVFCGTCKKEWKVPSSNWSYLGGINTVPCNIPIENTYVITNGGLTGQTSTINHNHQ